MTRSHVVRVPIVLIAASLGTSASCRDGKSTDGLGQIRSASTAGGIVRSAPEGELTTPVRLPGQLTVGDDGSANFELPIWVPEGRLGMQPSLAIRYSSRGGNGWLGPGWSLTGLSRITPCRHSINFDGYNRAVQLNPDENDPDPYCLDGARLVPVDGPVPSGACNGGQSYRTVPDSFRNVVACSSDGATPTTWYVYSKDGRIATYDERLDAPTGGPTKRLGWLLSEVADRNRNRWRVTYQRQDPGQDLTYFPKQIDYTLGNPDAAGGAEVTGATHQIKFLPAADDVVTAPVLRVHGVVVNPPPHLGTIEIYDHGAKLRQYVLEYETGERTGRRRLHSVKLCDADDVCSDPTVFEYTSDSFQPWTLLSSGTAGLERTSAGLAGAMHLADVNGDGKDDLIYQTRGDPDEPDNRKWYVRYSNGSGFDETPGFTLRGSPPHPNDPDGNKGMIFPASVDPLPSRIVDINNDGKAEMIFGYCNCQPNDVVTCDFDCPGIDPKFCHTPSNCHCKSQDPVCAYVGYTDFMNHDPPDCRVIGEKFVCVPDCIAVEGDASYCKPMKEAPFPWNAPAELVDIDSITPRWVDTRVRAFEVWYQPPQTPKGDVPPRAYRLDLLPNYRDNYAERFPPDSNRSLLRDLDGDGRMEILVPSVSGAAEFAVVRPRHADLDHPAADAEVSLPGLPYSPCYVWGDFNGDGYLDALDVQSNLLYAYDGVNFQQVAAPAFLTPPGLSLPTCDESFRDNDYRAVDYNGDGLLDLMVVGRMVSSGDEAARVFITAPNGRFATQAQLGTFPLLNASPHGQDVFVLDIDGDGQFDVLQFYPICSTGPFGSPTARPASGGDTSPQVVTCETGYQIFRRGDVQPPDLLVGVSREGLTDRVHYGSTPSTHGPIVVVDQQQIDFGPETTRAVLDHAYAGAVVDRNEGFLGVKVHVIVDHRTETTTELDYDLNKTTLMGHTVHALAGRPFRRLTKTPLGPGSGWHATRIETTYLADESSRFEYAQTIEARELEGTSVDDNAFNDGNSGLLAVTTVTRSVDAFGSDKEVTVTRRGNGPAVTPFSESARFTYGQDVPSQWLIGRPTREEVTSSAPGYSPETRVVDLHYDNFGNLDEITRNSAAAGSSLYQRTKLIMPDPASGVIREIWTLSSPDGSAGDMRKIVLGYEPTLTFPSSVTNDIGTTSVIVHTGLGVATATFDLNGLKTEIDYDLFGRQRAVRRPDGSSDTTVFHAAMTGDSCLAPIVVPRDSFSRATTQRSDGQVLSSCLDALGHPVRSIALGFDGREIWIERYFDNFGRMTSESFPFFQSSSLADVHFASELQFDPLGRLKSLSRDGGAHFSTFSYAGLSSRALDEEGRTTDTTRDAAGHTVATSIYPDGTTPATTRFTYGPFDTLRLIADAKADSANGDTTDIHHVSVTYDDVGRVASLLDRDQGARVDGATNQAVSHSYAYDSFDEIVSDVDADGRVTGFAYDGLGRLTRRSSNDESSFFFYDFAAGSGLGQIALSFEALNGIYKIYAYDDTGRLKRVDRLFDYGMSSVGYEYDAESRLTTLHYPDAANRGPFAVGYSYNAFGYLDAVRDVAAPPTAAPIWQAAGRDAMGRVTDAVVSTGVHTSRAYDPRTGRLASVVTTLPNTTTIQSMAYEYEANGNLRARTDNLLGQREVFGYDGANRLISAGLDGGAGSHSYQYDAIGNLTAVAEPGLAGCSWTYGENAGAHALTTLGCGATQYHLDYDGPGNVASDTRAGRAMTFAQFGKPLTVTQDGKSFQYLYDPDQERTIRRTTDGGSGNVYYIGDLHEHHALDDGSTNDLYFVYAEGEPVMQLSLSDSADSDDRAYIHTGWLGSPDVTSNAVGTAVAERLSFDAWGRRRNPDLTVAATPPTPNLRIGFTGHVHEDELGLIDMRGRVYDPVLKRFLSPDPFVQDPSYGPSWNRYGYVWNNPTNLIDPSGFQVDPFYPPFDPANWYDTGTGSNWNVNVGGGNVADIPGTNAMGGSHKTLQPGSAYNAGRDQLASEARGSEESVPSQVLGGIWDWIRPNYFTLWWAVPNSPSPFDQIADAVLANYRDDGARGVFNTFNPFYHMLVHGSAAGDAWGRGDVRGFVSNGLGTVSSAAGVVGIGIGGARVAGLNRAADLLAAEPTAAVGGSLKVAEDEAGFTGFLGSKRSQMANFPAQELQNADTVIGGRVFSGHAIDQMRNRGIMPSVVENAIHMGVESADAIVGRVRHFDSVNNLTIITEGGRVVTVIPGRLR